MNTRKASTSIWRRPLFWAAWAGVLLLISLIPAVQSALAQQPQASAGSNRTYLAFLLNRPVPPTPAPPSGDWLEQVNYYRALARLPGVTENPAWSHGDRLHARYMVINDYIGHSEDPSLPGYTQEGAAAGQNSNVMVSSNPAAADAAAIRLWMQGPFHALAILDSELQQVGFGSYREPTGTWQMGAALDVLRGLAGAPVRVTYPIRWPAPGLTVPHTSYSGGETPNPLTGCQGYTAPAGLPVILQLGPGDITPQVTAHSFHKDGVPVEHCVYDETSYSNPDKARQYLGRRILGARDAIVLMPRHPLDPGSLYTASITANGQAHVWDFMVSAGQPAASPGALLRAP